MIMSQTELNTRYNQVNMREIRNRVQQIVRKYQIYFDYPWTDHDEVTIELPEGFDLEGTQTPASLPINQVGEYKMNLSVNADGKLVYVRDFRFGDNNNVLFPVKAYPQIKRIFDYINKQDTQPVTLSNTAMNE